MSSAPITIVFKKDSTEVDAYLASLRATPLQATIALSPGALAGGSPATFGSPGAINPSTAAAAGFGTVPGSALGNVAQAAQSQQAAQLMAQAAAAIQSTAPAFAQAAAQMQQAASQINQAAALFNQNAGGGGSANPGSSPATIANPNNPNPNTNPRSLANFSRLRRIFTGGATVYTAVRALESIDEYRLALHRAERDGGQFGADPLRELEAKDQFVKSLASDVPLLGKFVDRGSEALFLGINHAFGGTAVSREDQIEAIKRQRRTLAAVLEVGIGAATSDARVRATGRSISLLDPVYGGIGTEKQQRADTLAGKADQFAIEERDAQNELRRLASAHDAEGYENAQFRYRVLKRSHAAELGAGGRLNAAQNREQDRLQGLQLDSEYRQIPGLIERGAGNFGRAAEEDFSAGLANRLAAAQELDRRKGGFAETTKQTILNYLERRAHDRQNEFSVQAQLSSTAATRSELNFRPQEAGFERLEQRHREAIRSASTDSQRDAERADYVVQRERIEQTFRLNAEGLAFGQGAANEGRGLILSASDPRLGALFARSNAVRRSVESDVRGIGQNAGISENDRDPLEAQALRGGIQQLQIQKAELLRNLHTEELDSINQQATSGPGTSDPSQAIQKISDDIDELKKILGDGNNIMQRALQALQSLKVQ